MKVDTNLVSFCRGQRGPRSLPLKKTMGQRPEGRDNRPLRPAERKSRMRGQDVSLAGSLPGAASLPRPAFPETRPHEIWARLEPWAAVARPSLTFGIGKRAKGLTGC